MIIKPNDTYQNFDFLKGCIGTLEPFFCIEGNMKLSCTVKDREALKVTVDTKKLGGSCLNGYIRLGYNVKGEKQYSEPLYFYKCF